MIVTDWQIENMRALANKYCFSIDQIYCQVASIFETRNITADMLEFIDEELAMRSGVNSVRN